MTTFENTVRNDVCFAPTIHEEEPEHMFHFKEDIKENISISSPNTNLV